MILSPTQKLNNITLSEYLIICGEKTCIHLEPVVILGDVAGGGAKFPSLLEKSTYTYT